MPNPSPSPTPEIPHTLVGSYYLVDENIEAKLLLNNKGNASLEVQPTLYNKQGQELQLPSVTVEPQNFRFINLADWAAIGGEGYKSGNIKLFHYGKDLVLGAQIYLTDETRSLSYEEKLTELGKFDSRRMEAVWWMPSSNAKVKIILTNTTDTPLDVTGRLAKKPNTVSNPQTVQLAAHQTKVFDLRDDFPNSNQFINAEVLALSLEHSGAKDALLGRVLLAEPQRGYSNVVQFSNPNGGKSAEYQGVGFQIEDIDGIRFAPIIVARNVGTTTATVTTKVPYTRANGTRGTINLPPKQLLAGELGLINTQNIITRVQQENIKVASLEITYNTPNGSVIMAAHSVSEDRNQVFRVPLWDPFGQRSPTGGYPWRIEGTSVTQTYIKNIADYEEDYVAFLVWENGGMYMLGLKPIAAHETVQIDVKNLRDEQIPDEQGRTIPLHISSGQMQWTLRRKDNLPDDDTRANLSLIGRSEQVDLTKGYSNNYACQNCCAGDFSFGYVFPHNTQIPTGNTVQYEAYEEGTTCYGSRYIYRINHPNWSSSNQDVATINSSGVATTVGNGQTNIRARWWTTRYFETQPCNPGPLLWENENSADECNKEDFKKTIQEIPSNFAPCGSCTGLSSQINGDTTLTVTNSAPQVASIKAELASTRNVNTNQAPPIGSFTTTNNSIVFANENTSDLMVVFQGNNSVSIEAQGITPTNSASQIKWKIDRDPNDTVASGLPTLNSTVGSQIMINPTTAGNFRLICYFDSNNNEIFDEGEQLRVLLLAIVRFSVNESNCQMETIQAAFQGIHLPTNQDQVNTAGVIMGITCDVLLESGGNNKRIGVNKVTIGNVGNLIIENTTINYPVPDPSPPPPGNVIGTGVEYPGVDTLPMIDVTGIDPGTEPTGGTSAFRGNSNESNPRNGQNGGQIRTITSNDNPDIGLWESNHPTTGNLWQTTQGGHTFSEFLVAFSDTFPRNYVVLGKADWSVNYIGERRNNLWIDNGSSVFIQGVPFNPNGEVRVPFTLTITNGSPQSANSAGVQVLGLSYTNEYEYRYDPDSFSAYFIGRYYEKK